MGTRAEKVGWADRLDFSDDDEGRAAHFSRPLFVLVGAFLRVKDRSVDVDGLLHQSSPRP